LSVIFKYFWTVIYEKNFWSWFFKYSLTVNFEFFGLNFLILKLKDFNSKINHPIIPNTIKIKWIKWDRWSWKFSSWSNCPAKYNQNKNLIKISINFIVYNLKLPIMSISIFAAFKINCIYVMKKKSSFHRPVVLFHEILQQYHHNYDFLKNVYDIKRWNERGKWIKQHQQPFHVEWKMQFMIFNDISIHNRVCMYVNVLCSYA